MILFRLVRIGGRRALKDDRPVGKRRLGRVIGRSIHSDGQRTVIAGRNGCRGGSHRRIFRQCVSWRDRDRSGLLVQRLRQIRLTTGRFLMGQRRRFPNDIVGAQDGTFGLFASAGPRSEELDPSIAHRIESVRARATPLRLVHSAQRRQSGREVRRRPIHRLAGSIDGGDLGNEGFNMLI